MLARRWLLCRLLLTVSALIGPSTAAISDRQTLTRNITVKNPKQVFELGPSTDQFEDIEVELFGMGTSSVLSVTVTLHGASGPIRRTLSVPPSMSSSPPSPALKWLLCDSSKIVKVEVHVEWKKAGNQANRRIRCTLRRKNMLWRGSDKWRVKHIPLEYRRLNWSETGDSGAVVIRSVETPPAVACLRYKCADELDTLSVEEEMCHEFTRYTSFRLLRRDTMPSFLYIRPLEPNKTTIGKAVDRIAIRKGTLKSVTAWLSLPENAPPRPVPPVHSSKPDDHDSTPAAESSRRETAVEAPTSTRTPSSHIQYTNRGGVMNIATKTEKPPTRSAVTGDRDSREPRRDAHQGTAGGHPQFTITDDSDGPVSVSNSGSHSIHININSNNVAAEPGQPSPPPPSVAPAAGRASAAPTTRPAAGRGPEPLEKEVRGVVSRRQPRTLQFRVTQHQAEGGVLRLEMNANWTLEALLHFTTASKVLRVQFGRDGSSASGEVQLCPRQLPDGLLTTTVTTSSDQPVAFSARLRQPDDRLRLDAPEEVVLAQNQSQIREVVFPDWRSPVGLEVDTSPNTCMLVSVFKKMCGAVSGRLQDAVLHKYLSGVDYLPVANALEYGRRAFLRTEWASPEQCGLPAPAAALPAPLQALLSLAQHEEPEAWLRLLLPPVSLAVMLPAVVLWLVRGAAARLRRGAPSDDEGVTISELPNTPRLPRHVPRLTTGGAGTEKPALTTGGAGTEKPALTTGGAGTEKPALTSTAAGTGRPVTLTGGGGDSGARSPRSTVLSEAGYPDLSEEKRRQAAVVSQQPPDVSTQAADPELSEQKRQQQQAAVGAEAVYPDISEEKRQLAAGLSLEAAEGGEGGADGQKERLAAQLGVGGAPSAPSAPPEPEDGEAGTALLSTRSDDSICQTSEASCSALLGRPGSAAGPVAVSRRPMVSGVFCLSVAAVVLTTAGYFSATALQAFGSGDAGVCPASPLYTVMAVGVPGVGGLVNLVPTLAYGGCLWWLRSAWKRRASPALVGRGMVWPVPGLEWLLLAYGVQAAVAGLCPGHSYCFTTNTFVVAFLGALTASRAAGFAPELPLSAAVAGSALVSAPGWLPAPLGGVATAGAVIGQLWTAAALYGRLLLPPDTAGPLSVGQQLRLLAPSEVAPLAAVPLLTAVLGVTVLSPGGYLAMAGISTLATTLWITGRRKGSVSSLTLFSPYSKPALVTGTLVFVAAITIGELAYAGYMGLLKASSIGGLVYLISCFLLALGISPRRPM